VRKEDHVLTWQRRMTKNNAYGVYFIFKSMEQGPTFRISMPKAVAIVDSISQLGLRLSG
jgi:hypothetical protein